MKTRLLPIAAALALAFVLPAGLATLAHAEDKVVATINGKAITEADLTVADGEIGADMGNMPPDQKRMSLVEFLIDNQLFAEAAEGKKLSEGPDFESRLNKEMVQLESIDADAGSLKKIASQGGDVAVALQTVMGDMREQDVERLHALISRHAHYTNSKTAQKILKDFAAYLPKFKKVMPVEYRRALADLAKAKSASSDKPRTQA
ncbi:MAG: hypothetical protein ABL893_19475 [Hyphomicrobium sp.]